MIWEYILCVAFNCLSLMASAAVAAHTCSLFGEERVDVGFEEEYIDYSS
jgi:hypothetical protein